MYQIITFYEFKDMNFVGELSELKADLRKAMAANAINGTIILAAEGFNSTVSGTQADIERFISVVQSILKTELKIKSSFSAEMPFQKIDVKIKPEIVTLKKEIDTSLGDGTHVKPADWNAIIADPNVIVLDARNSYEFESGTFVNAINPGTEKFSELPEFVEKNLDPSQHKQIAMFCTGGIRCEKFAPYLKARGFETIFQLEGG
ncbi:MAG: oxygen-dependent tRNA uridine(34) hydroxylase TrhO, partial [Blastocatellia bacterium]